jgi:hypothetical protein
MALCAALMLAGCTFSFGADDEKQALPTPTAGTPELQREAADAANHYLQLIDARKDDEVWERAGRGLHATSSKRVFLSALKLARTFSLPDKRELDGFGFTPKVDAAWPEGDYVVVQYKAIAGNVVAIERVVMQREDDAWKLAGYHVNKRAQTSGD